MFYRAVCLGMAALLLPFIVSSITFPVLHVLLFLLMNYLFFFVMQMMLNQLKGTGRSPLTLSANGLSVMDSSFLLVKQLPIILLGVNIKRCQI